MAIYFHEELLFEILVRLPVKSLLRFRCVSKSWNALITSSDLVTAHMKHNTSTSHNALVRCYYQKTRNVTYALHSDDENFDRIMEVDFPFRNAYEFYILGSANGLVCLVDSYHRTNAIMLWNPVIRRTLTLPKPNYELTTDELAKTAFGFGFSALDNDYKVVRIYSVKGKSTMDIFKLSTHRWSNADSWTCIPAVTPDYASCLHGILHWFVYKRYRWITGFDLGTETFGEIKLPKALECRNVCLLNMAIVVWREQLSVFEMQSMESTYLWVMKEYGVEDSWCKQFKIAGFVPLRSIRRNGQLIFLSPTNGNVVFYEPEAQETKANVLLLEGPLFQLQIMPYVQTLVLLDQGKS